MTSTRGELLAALENIIAIDQTARKTCTEVDSAGNSYRVEMVDGPCAEIARKLLGVVSPPSEAGREWLPIDAAARDGREVLLRRMPDGPIHAGYFGLAQFAFGAGASTMYPWTVLDNTNGVNQLRDGGETGVTHYRALSPDHGTVAVASGHPLERLWQAIVDNTTDESFWIAEILLHQIEKETGFNGNGSPSVASADRGTP